MRTCPRPPDRSPLAEALDLVGDRWTLLVVAALLDGPRRFGDLQRELGRDRARTSSPSACATSRRSGSSVAQPYSERPPRMVYELTAAGRDLAGALRQLADWGARQHEGAEPPRHAACGTPLEARWYCPTCERPVDDDDAEELHYA